MSILQRVGLSSASGPGARARGRAARARCAASPSRANGLSAPCGSASRYASSSSALPGQDARERRQRVGARRRGSPRSEMRLSIGEEPLPRGLELLRATASRAAPQRLEALAHRQRVLDHPRRRRRRARSSTSRPPCCSCAIQAFSGSAGGGAGKPGPRPQVTPDVLRDHVRERVDVVLPGPVEVALEEQVRVVQPLAVEAAARSSSART